MSTGSSEAKSHSRQLGSLRSFRVACPFAKAPAARRGRNAHLEIPGDAEDRNSLRRTAISFPRSRAHHSAPRTALLQPNGGDGNRHLFFTRGA